LLDQTLRRAPASRTLVEPVVFLVTAGDDVGLVEKQRAPASIAAQPSPVGNLNWLFAASLAQENWIAGRGSCGQRLFTLDGPRHTTAHVALQIGDVERPPLRFSGTDALLGEGHVVRLVLSALVKTQ